MNVKRSLQSALVVATVASLGGEEIEPYANQLFRAWKLGEKTKNNGVLLLVAPKERKVRIEVGYGLEGTLTDALSKVIIVNVTLLGRPDHRFSGKDSQEVPDEFASTYAHIPEEEITTEDIPF